MFNATSKLNSKKEHFSLSDLSFAERVIYWTIVLTPLWWLLGIQTLFYPAVVIGLLVISFDFDKLVRTSLPNCAWAWLAMAIVMLWTAMIGISNVGFGLTRVAATFITFFKGYFLIFACLALPFGNQIRVKVITRAVAWMAGGYLIAIALQLIMLLVGVGRQTFFPPIAYLIPGNKSLIVWLSAFLNPLFGIPLPRSTLYMPDPPIPGICGLLCFFICLGESNPRLRKFSLAGSLAALLISHSRLAWVCLPLAILAYVSFRSFFARQLSLWLFSLTAFLSSLWQLTLPALMNKPLEIFHNARPSSSKDREFVIQKTMEAWQQSPWLGWGIPQGTANWYTYEVTLGSFSTYAGVLYLHGIVGFMVFIAALALTLRSFWQPALEGNALCKKAFVSLIALYLFIHGLPLSWITVYIWFFFLWLGAILAEILENPPSYSSQWQQLSRKT
ncbi:MAG: O-antigen ligase family protein [Xenococcaceae cyanobacterium MO_207.B15]|nr:O-antigen ligase family protein [Xenococcaceae cyanobacterium MO_207.B15]